MRILVLFLVFISSTGAFAQKSDEEAVRAVIGEWYAELKKGEDGYPRRLVAPDFIDSTPHYTYVDTGSAALGPRIYTSLAVKALRFEYDIERMRIDPNFAKVDVWERGYFYASAAQKTYELAMDTVFILERRENGWLIAAHQSGGYGIPPNKVTNPMPDLRDLYYETYGGDPEADALKAGKF